MKANRMETEDEVVIVLRITPKEERALRQALGFSLDSANEERGRGNDDECLLGNNDDYDAVDRIYYDLWPISKRKT